MKIEHVALYVNDLEKARDFSRNILVENLMTATKFSPAQEPQATATTKAVSSASKIIRLKLRYDIMKLIHARFT